MMLLFLFNFVLIAFWYYSVGLCVIFTKELSFMKFVIFSSYVCLGIIISVFPLSALVRDRLD
jgi:hypothetical protein